MLILMLILILILILRLIVGDEMWGFGVDRRGEDGSGW